MDLSLLRLRTGRLLLGLLWALVPLTPVIGLLDGQTLEDSLLGGALAVVAAAAAAGIAVRRGPGSSAAAQSLAVALMLVVSVHVWLAPVWLTIDLHMAYFAGLALLAGLVDWRAILAGAATVAVHHLTLNFAAPELVFGVAEGNLGRVLLHAAVLVVEATTLIMITRELETAAAAATAALRDAEAARAAEVTANERRLAQEAEAAAAGRTARQAVATTVETNIGRIVAAVENASGALDGTARRLGASAGVGAR